MYHISFILYGSLVCYFQHLFCLLKWLYVVYQELRTWNYNMLLFDVAYKWPFIKNRVAVTNAANNMKAKKTNEKFSENF